MSSLHRLTVFDQSTERAFDVLSEHVPRVGESIILAASVWTVIDVENWVYSAEVPYGPKDRAWTRIIVDDERLIEVRKT